MTPNDIDILLHYYTTPEEHGRIAAPAVSETVHSFLDRGILRLVTSDEKARWAGSYRVTEKGNKLVEMLCATPDPVNRWIDPREEPNP